MAIAGLWFPAALAVSPLTLPTLIMCFAAQPAAGYGRPGTEEPPGSHEPIICRALRSAPLRFILPRLILFSAAPAKEIFILPLEQDCYDQRMAAPPGQPMLQALSSVLVFMISSLTGQMQTA